MGYQALLFCPDEKIARVVSQVFTELDFSIEPIHEPFAAVKKLMAQRYDAIVVDCENEQNASLLFKSARNSSSNQSSLAIAVVEGQAGVAKAYRIGANLVLTKPINVEQAKGTLRVARGLLRKNQDAAGVNAAAVSPAAPVLIQAKTSETVAAPPRESKPTETRSAPVQPENTKNSVYETGPLPVPTPLPATAHAAMTTAPVAGEKVEAATSTPAAVPGPAAAISSSNSAAAVAPAKIAASENIAEKAEETGTQSQTFRNAAHSAPEFEAYESAPAIGSTPSAQESIASPTFGAIDEELSETSKGSKKFLIAACLVVVAVLGYFAYQKFGAANSTTTAPDRVVAQSGERPVVAQSNSAQPSVPPVPTSQPASSGSAASPLPGNNSHSSSAKVSSAKPSSGIAENTVKVIADSGTAVDQPISTASNVNVPATPVKVKSSIGSGKHAEDVAPPPSSSFAVANDNKLSGLMASTATSLPKPALNNVRVSQGVSQGLLIKRVAPVYPAAARSTHTQGEVRIEATVNKDGMVVNPKVVRGDTVLAHAALEAVRQWRYKPYYLDGQPVEIQTEITINFKAD